MIDMEYPFTMFMWFLIAGGIILSFNSKWFIVSSILGALGLAIQEEMIFRWWKK